MSESIRRIFAIFAILSVLVAAGCGGSVSRAANGSGAAVTAEATWSGGEAAPASAQYGGGASASAEYRPSPEPETRPGLGTEFGEQVHSHVNRTAFYRGSQSPFASVAMFYNDAEGVQAQAAYRGGFGQVRAATPNGGISVWVTDEGGRVLPGTSAGGHSYVVGADGARYKLVIQNNTGGRYEVVASVDGLDVIDGQPASPNKRGYIVPPHGQVVIDGFRTSDNSVAAFRFGAVSQSYAARTSGDRNVGVIGFAFFAERGSPWTTDQLHRRETANPFPGYAQPPRY